MNQLEIFKNREFGEIRTVVIEGEPWFVGTATRMVHIIGLRQTGLINPPDILEKRKLQK